MTSTTTYMFRGTLEDCLAHFGEAMKRSYPPAKGSEKKKQPMADFCEVGIATVQRWLIGGNKPKAEEMLKVAFFLELQGYQVMETGRLEPGVRGCAELVAYGVYTLLDLSKELGYTLPNHFSLVLQGKENASDERRAAMWEIWKGKREELEQKKSDARKRFIIPLPNPVPPQQILQKPTSSPCPFREVRPSRRAKALLCMVQSVEELLGDEPLGNIPKQEFLELGVDATETILRLNTRLSILASDMKQLFEEHARDNAKRE